MVADEDKVFKPDEVKRKEKEAEDGKTVETEKTADEKGKRVKPEHHEEKAEEKKREIVLQRLYVVDLSAAFRKPEPRHQRSAVRLLRQFVSKHAKSSKIRISPGLAAEAAKARRLRISVTKDKEGLAEATLQ